MLVLFLLFCITLTFSCSSSKTSIQKQTVSNSDNNQTSKSIAPVEKSEAKPIMVLKPNKFTIGVAERLVAREIKIMNKGNGPLHITKVETNCNCSKATILENDIYPMTTGKAILYMDLNGLYDDKNIIDYEFYSNASNSPELLRVIVDTNIKK